jgi:hypothetical protein
MLGGALTLPLVFAVTVSGLGQQGGSRCNWIGGTVNKRQLRIRPFSRLC